MRRVRGTAGRARWGWAVHVAAVVALVAGAQGCATAKLTKEDQEKADYHYQLAANHFSDKQIPQAIRELTLSLEKDPQHADALHLMGFIAMGRQNYPQAVDFFKRAIEARPDFYICINNLGTALLASHRWDEAILVYEELINKPTYNTPELAYNNLGWAYHEAGQGDRAEEMLQMAIFLKPDLCLSYNNLGIVQLERKNTVGATRSLQQAIKRCPTYQEPHFHLGQLLREKQDPKAREYYQRCYEIGPENTWGERCLSYLELYSQ